MHKKITCNKDNLIIEAMQVINDNGIGVVFIIDNDERLYGIATDGDIRRALLNNIGLETKIGMIANRDFIYGFIDDTYETLAGKTSKRINTIPLLSKENKVIDYFRLPQDIYFPVAAPYLRGNEFKYITDAFLSTWISSSGHYIDRFENDFSQFCGRKYGIATSNGTCALHLALLALGIGSGDEVIIPDLTFAATINSVLHSNATPVIVDIEEDSWCIDPECIERAISPRTKAIIPVHLYGQPAAMDRIMTIANKHNLYVIEDCAEAHGALFNNQPVGSFGDVSCFSFYGNKILTTGEGGMCLTNSDKHRDAMQLLRDHGMSKQKRYWHEIIGYNYRMTNIQAAIGCAQLERIDQILHAREEYENYYVNELNECPNVTFQDSKLPLRKKVTWLVSMLLGSQADRDSAISKLQSNGIDARPFFYPLSTMDIYRNYLHSNKTSIGIASRGINLPTYADPAHLREIKRNVDLIKSAFE